MNEITNYIFPEIKDILKKKNYSFHYHKNDIFKLELLKAAEAGRNVYENEVNKLDNYPVARDKQMKYSITDVFRNHWNEFIKIQESKGKPIRPAIIKNVDLMINCKNFKNGYLFFSCPNCDSIHIQGLSCHSRFCPSCGKKYRDARLYEASNTLIYTPHRYITWTIPMELRGFFQRHRKMYNILFEAVNDVLTYIVQGKSPLAKNENRRLGFISTIHTFGRDMKFNPHIHTLCTECTIDKNGKKLPFNSFSFSLLRKGFMKQVLKKMYHYLKNHEATNELNNFSRMRAYLYKKHKNGFYVHAPKANLKSLKSLKQMISYTLRYSNHPAMSESRILHYDREKRLIYYYYDPHEDDNIENENDKIGRQYVRESVFEFISKLIVHISEDGVHNIRYYGFYANHSLNPTQCQPKLFKANELKEIRKNQSWRYRLFISYGYDPLLCHCGSVMIYCRELSYFKGYDYDDG